MSCTHLCSNLAKHLKTLASTKEQCEQKSQLCIAPGPQMKIGWSKSQNKKNKGDLSGICFIPKTYVDFRVFPFTVPLGLRRGPPRSRPARFLQGLDVLAEDRYCICQTHHITAGGETIWAIMEWQNRVLLWLRDLEHDSVMAKARKAFKGS